MKDYIPKSFEHIVVSKIKPKIVRNVSKFQIGALPGHQAREHLFVIKSTVALYMWLNLPMILQFYDLRKFFDSESLRDAMSSLYHCGVKGKLYRLLFELNKSNTIKIKTGVGETNCAELGETVSQGSIAGGLVSAANLDHSVNNFFKNSQYEPSYINIRMQPLIYQDDLARCSLSVKSAHAGNKLIETCLETKLLDLHSDKSCFLLVGKNKTVECLRKDLAVNPLTLYNKALKEKTSEKYLGDQIHSAGNTASAKETVNERYGKTVALIIEARAIIEDCRLNTAGGLSAGIEIWEMAYLPGLLNNCETWVDIDQTTIDLLDELQNMMYRSLLSTPKSTPTPALCWDMGGILMKYRIIIKKMIFLNHIQNLGEKSLAKEVQAVQQKLKLPGLTKECVHFIQVYDLPNLILI